MGKRKESIRRYKNVLKKTGNQVAAVWALIGYGNDEHGKKKKKARS
jgi:hypothetical protein